MHNWIVSTVQPATRLALTSVVPVWTLVIVGSILIGLFLPPARYLEFLPFVLAAAVLVTFCIQLAIVQKNGLVDRMMACLGGSVVLLAIATVGLSIVQRLAT